MSFPDPAQQPPLPPLLPLPFASEDVDRFWPTPPMNGAVSQFEDPPGFKRPMNYENNPSNFAPFAQIKFCDEINKSWTLKGRAIYFTRLVFVQNSPKVTNGRSADTLSEKHVILLMTGQSPGACVETELVINTGRKIPEEPLLIPLIGSSHATAVVFAPANTDAESKKWRLDRQVKGICAD
ncbi:Hypothetical predicted protein [Olea europaea subsp. europaea]|uniref:Uncharacterized protein n=1 Tax=Olea europaea subsp. europaea TaxID=158383 RepID=A0A8S0V183_OLEEU|nr:Hypothetical predicted protein [Olea europaea subsp. europaea]